MALPWRRGGVLEERFENYVVELQRKRPWRCIGVVWMVQAHADQDPIELVTVRAMTRRGARRRAVRFITLRRELMEAAVSRG
jgi:hypothetical protein